MLLNPLLGNTDRIRILEAMLIGAKTRASIKTLTEESNTGKTRTYEIIKDLLQKKLIKTAGKQNNKQTYTLNYANKNVQKLDTFYKALLLNQQVTSK